MRLRSLAWTLYLALYPAPAPETRGLHQDSLIDPSSRRSCPGLKI